MVGTSGGSPTRRVVRTFPNGVLIESDLTPYLDQPRHDHANRTMFPLEELAKHAG
jgi:hypothetical protein